jgi:hypothetical protein
MRTTALRAVEDNPPVAIAEKAAITSTNAHMLRVIGRTSYQSGKSLSMMMVCPSKEDTIVLPMLMVETMIH